MNKDRFKYRVWDKYTHETPAEQMQFLCFNGCLVDSDGCHHSPDDYIIEQCTGIKDKNGVLVYEGDVVEHDTGGVYDVIWCDTDCGWAIRHRYNRNIRTLNCFDGDELKIISNIHDATLA